jgi:hypothetical protein
MRTDPAIVAELRKQFVDGATPSRLIQYILEQHPTDCKGDKYRLIQGYFEEAFRIPLVRNLRRDDSYSSESLQYAFLNESLLHEMIVNEPQWNPTPKSNQVCSSTWLEPLTATAEEELLNHARSTPPRELADSWNDLGQSERAYILRLIANLTLVHERSTILARLAERLQQKVVDLEKRLAEKERTIAD